MEEEKSDIWQAIFSNAFSWKNIVASTFKFHGLFQVCFHWSNRQQFSMAWGQTKDTPFPTLMMGQALHYSDVIMGAMGSQITSRTIVYPPFIQGADQRKHQSFASLAFVWGIHRWPVNSPHKGPVTRKIFPFDDVIILDLSSTSLGKVYKSGLL